MTTLAAAAAPDPTGSLGRDFATGRAWSENTHSLALLLGLDGTIVDLNQQMADTLGQPIEELKGTLLWHQPAFASGAEWQGPFQKVLEARNALRLDTEYGGRWYDTSFTPCLDSSGKAIGVSIVGWDITERKRAETALRESEERHRSQIENLVNGFAYCRMDYLDGRPHDFTYLKVNRAFEELSGMKDVVGRKVSEVIPNIREVDPQLLEVCGRVAQKGVPERFEMHLKTLDRWFSVSVSARKTAILSRCLT